MNTQDFADQWIRNTKCPTGIKCDFESGSFGGDNYEIFANYIQDKYGDKQFGTMESAHWVLDQRFTDMKQLYFMDVLEGKLSAKEAIKKIRQSICNK